MQFYSNNLGTKTSIIMIQLGQFQAKLIIFVCRLVLTDKIKIVMACCNAAVLNFLLKNIN